MFGDVINLNTNFMIISQNKALVWWLTICCLLIILVIFVGGLTRLTNAGLSIIEWKPITGIIPPLNFEQWQNEFAKYQLSPEYEQYNSTMHLSEFKFIYYLEFIHRLLGRLIVLAFTIPFFCFYYKNQILAKQKISYFIILVLLLAQGVAGWYMVKSGLTKIPHVSHYRLALHLMIAVFVYSLLFWQLENNLACNKSYVGSTITIKICFVTIILLYCQIFFGALVAGLKGGYIYNNFPLMGGNFVPHEISRDIASFSLSSPVFVQFIHRIIAYAVFIMTLLLIVLLMKKDSKSFYKMNWSMLFVLLFQIFSGIMTLIYVVPVPLALIHQLGAILLLSVLLHCYHVLTINHYASSSNHNPR